MPQLPVFYAGPTAGPTLDEATTAQQWNQADLPPLEAAVGLASTQHDTWSTALAAAQASMPRVTRFLLDPAIPRLLAALATRCSDFRGDIAAQRANPTVAGFHAVRASHDRVQAAAAEPTLVSALGPAGTLATVGAAYQALPADVLTAVDNASDPVLRILTRQPSATITAMSAVPAQVVEMWDAKPVRDILGSIENAAWVPAEMALCRAAFTTLDNSIPSITDFPAAMYAGVQKQAWEEFKPKITEARSSARATKARLWPRQVAWMAVGCRAARSCGSWRPPWRRLSPPR
jgi:hypothetical protein